MEARKLKRPNVGECQKIYDKYGIDDSIHTGTTTDLCAVIQELEQSPERVSVDAIVSWLDRHKHEISELYWKRLEEELEIEYKNKLLDGNEVYFQNAGEIGFKVISDIIELAKTEDS